MGIFNKLKETLSKTKENISSKVEDVLKSFKKVDDELFDELEEVLITADLGVNTSVEIIDRLRDVAKEKRINESLELKTELAEILKSILSDNEDNHKVKMEGKPSVIMVICVNGVGKTTSIGKIANMYKNQGKSVIVAAADTFRAAAIDQLLVWGERANVPVISQQEGADPAAVIFDTVSAAKKRGADVILCDTAGRLHNKKNLMEELKKIYRVLERELPGSSKEVLLVLDATTGQNAVVQAKEFKEAADITGIVLTKLDGTAKGGIVFAIKNEYNIPVKLIGTGEKMEDISEFSPEDFVNAIIDIANEDDIND